MTVDAAGNLYAAVQSEVWAWTPTGQSLFELPIPQSPSNVDFGGEDGRTLFITAQTSLYGIELNVPSPARGDYDGDGEVTAADYLIWSDTLGATENHSADGNGNRMIDIADLGIWQARFGNSLLAVSAASDHTVCEPATMLPLLLAAACAIIRRPARRG
jgi:hypothetical protein